MFLQNTKEPQLYRHTRFRIVRSVRFFLALYFRYRIRFQSNDTAQISIAYQNLAKELKVFFLKMGGAYIKMGQFFGSLSHLLPQEFTREFEGLQDRVPGIPLVQIQKRVESELAISIDKEFTYFTKDPIASASTAQVHLAEWKGERIAIKVLYPGIENIVRRDLRAIRILLFFLSRFLFTFPSKEIAEQIEELLEREMDLTQEKASIEKMGKFFSKEKEIFVPRVYGSFCTKGILATEFVDGIKINQILPNRSPQGNKIKALELLFRAYVLMIFQFRTFHADPHPGNLLYTADGRLCLIDFGAIGELSEKMAKSIESILLHSINQNYYGVVDALEDMGIIRKNSNRETILEIVRYALRKLKRFINDTQYFQNIPWENLGIQEDLIFLQELQTSLRELSQILVLPPQYIALQRVLALLIGNTAFLDPYRTLLDYAEEPFEKEILGVAPFPRFLRDEKDEFLANLLILPKELNRYLYLANRERKASKPPSSGGIWEMGIKTLLLFSPGLFLYFARWFWERQETGIVYTLVGLSVFSVFALFFSFLKKPNA